jgi:hypothetical protein
MSIDANYQLYCKQGGTFTKGQYIQHLNAVTDTIGNLINKDPDNFSSDIGKRIFNVLITNLQDAVSFSRVSKGLNRRATTSWFSTKSREIVLRYVKQGAAYKNYLLQGGWNDLIMVGVKVAGVALTIASGIKANQHQNQIPPDAPTKQVKFFDDGEWYEVTVIDHPEARLAQLWKDVSYFTGGITFLATLGQGIDALTKNANLTAFFSVPEKDILGSESTNCAISLISPDFHEWKINTIKEKLGSNPPNWRKHEVLSKMICPISNDFMLFPVKDRCNHYFDYRSLRAYQLNLATADPHACPITHDPNKLDQIQFDVGLFNQIQGIIRS